MELLIFIVIPSLIVASAFCLLGYKPLEQLRIILKSPIFIGSVLLSVLVAGLSILSYHFIAGESISALKTIAVALFVALVGKTVAMMAHHQATSKDGSK